MSVATPRKMLRWSLRVMYSAGTVAALTALAWGMGWLPTARPHLVMMAFQMFLLVAVGSGCVAAVASGQLAIAQAFRAGFMAGQLTEHGSEEVTRRATQQVLRAVQ